MRFVLRVMPSRSDSHEKLDVPPDALCHADMFLNEFILNAVVHYVAYMFLKHL